MNEWTFFFFEMLNTYLKDCAKDNKIIVHTRQRVGSRRFEESWEGNDQRENIKTKWGIRRDPSTGPAGLTLLKSAGLHWKADFQTGIKNSRFQGKDFFLSLFVCFRLLHVEQRRKDAKNYFVCTLKPKNIILNPWFHLFMPIIQVRWPLLPSNAFQQLLGDPPKVSQCFFIFHFKMTKIKQNKRNTSMILKQSCPHAIAFAGCVMPEQEVSL